MTKHPSQLLTDEQAVSSTISYALIIGILSILLVTVMTGVSAYTDTQQSAIERTELNDISNTIVNTIMTANRRANSPGNTTAQYKIDTPERAGGKTYKIELIQKHSTPHVQLSTNEITITNRLPTSVTIDTNATVTGGEFYLVIEEGEITLKNPSEVPS